MSYSIGPINLRSLTNHGWSASQTSLTTDIQSQPQVGYAVGQEMISYNLIGSFFADTATEARIQRQQINDIIANPSLKQIYITFDQDDEELSGWFAIDNLETTIENSIFNHYPFTLGVRRIKGGGALTSQIWKSYPYSHDYVNSAENWVAMPNGRGNLSGYGKAKRFGGEGGTNLIENDMAETKSYPTYNQTFSHTNSDIYLSRCYIYDTINSNTTSDPNNPSEVNWIERFGTYTNFTGDVVFGNGLIRYIWDEVLGEGKLYVVNFVSLQWELACNSFTLAFSDAPTTLTEAHKPTIEYFDWNKIIWHENFTQAEGRNVSIRYKMLRGSYTLHVSIKSDHGNLQATSGITKYSGNTHSSYSENLSTSNYRVALGSTVLGSSIQYGFFYTDGGAGGGAGGAVTLGYTTSEKVWTRLGLFAASVPFLRDPTLTVSTLADQYLANMDFQESIINPIMMV